MGKFAQPQTAQEAPRGADKPTLAEVRQAVCDVLQAHMERFSATRLPEPMPPNLGDGVRWWIGTMQEPARWHEQPMSVRTTGGGTRWDYPYQTRVVDNLLTFLRMPKNDRSMIVAGRDDGVFWRGEPVSVFIPIVDETHKMRRDGVKEYIRNGSAYLAKLRRDIRR